MSRETQKWLDLRKQKIKRKATKRNGRGAATSYERQRGGVREPRNHVIVSGWVQSVEKGGIGEK